METSLRYGGDSKAIRIHAKENLPIATNKHFQVHAALDTGSGDLSYFSGIIRNFYPKLSTTLGVGLLYDKQEKIRYTVRGKTKFPVTTNGLLSFIIKGRYNADEEFKEKKPSGAAELSWSIFNFQKDQDVRLKVGYEVFNKELFATCLYNCHAAAMTATKCTAIWQNRFPRLFRRSITTPNMLRLFPKYFDLKVPYLQVRENNWTLNADMKGRWYVRFDL